VRACNEKPRHGQARAPARHARGALREPCWHPERGGGFAMKSRRFWNREHIASDGTPKYTHRAPVPDGTPRLHKLFLARPARALTPPGPHVFRPHPLGLVARGLCTHRWLAMGAPPAPLALSRLSGTRRSISRDPAATVAASSVYSESRRREGAGMRELHPCKGERGVQTPTRLQTPCKRGAGGAHLRRSARW